MFSHKNAAISAWLSLMIGIKSVSCKPPLRHGLSGTISGLYYNGFRPYNQAISKKTRNCFPMRLTFALSCVYDLSLIHISEPTRLGMISYAVFCLKKKNEIDTEKVTL